MQHRIRIEIGLLHPPPLECDLAIERRGQTVDDPVLHLDYDGIGIDRETAIDRTVDATHTQTVISDRDLSYLGNDRTEGLMHRDAAEMPGWRRLVPIGHGGRPFGHGSMPWLLGQLVEPEHVRILSGGVCQLVDETLDVEAGNAVADGAPEADRDADILQHIFDTPVRRGIWRGDGAFDRARVDAVFHSARKCPSHDRGRDDLEVPGRHLASSVEARSQPSG